MRRSEAQNNCSCASLSSSSGGVDSVFLLLLLFMIMCCFCVSLWTWFILFLWVRACVCARVRACVRVCYACALQRVWVFVKEIKKSVCSSCFLVCVFNAVFFSSVNWERGLNIEQPVDCERWSVFLHCVFFFSFCNWETKVIDMLPELNPERDSHVWVWGKRRTHSKLRWRSSKGRAAKQECSRDASGQTY